MKKSSAFFLVLSLTQLINTAYSVDPFPLGPDSRLTPGALCERPNAYRYPEKIPYCNRSVSGGLKQEVIKNYDQKLGYQVEQMNRKDFKIDHYIPLCMGGSNEDENLWPQHVSVYTITDPLEQTACDKMAQGRLKQIDAVEFIKRAKADLKAAPEILKHIQAL